MKAKSMVIPLAVLLLVLASSVALAEAKVIQKVRKFPIDMHPWEDYGYPYLRIVGWLTRVYGEEETPQGIHWHLRILVQFNVIDERTGEYVGKGRHKFTYNGFVDGYMEEQNAVVNIPGPDMQGIERRKKILTVIVDGAIKVDVYIDVIAF